MKQGLSLGSSYGFMELLSVKAVKECVLPVLQTVLLHRNGSVKEWVFTSRKTGVVMRKHKQRLQPLTVLKCLCAKGTPAYSASTVSQIVEGLQGSISPPSLTAPGSSTGSVFQRVYAVTMWNGEEQQLEMKEFMQLIGKNKYSEQCFPEEWKIIQERPRRNEETYFVDSCREGQQLKHSCRKIIKSSVTNKNKSEKIIDSVQTQEESYKFFDIGLTTKFSEMNTTLIEALESNLHCVVAECQTSYLIDNQRQPLLITVRLIKVYPRRHFRDSKEYKELILQSGPQQTKQIDPFAVVRAVSMSPTPQSSLRVTKTSLSRGKQVQTQSNSKEEQMRQMKEKEKVVKEVCVPTEEYTTKLNVLLKRTPILKEMPQRQQVCNGGFCDVELRNLPLGVEPKRTRLPSVFKKVQSELMKMVSKNRQKVLFKFKELNMLEESFEDEYFDLDEPSNSVCDTCRVVYEAAGKIFQFDEYSNLVQCSERNEGKSFTKKKYPKSQGFSPRYNQEGLTQQKPFRLQAISEAKNTIKQSRNTIKQSRNTIEVTNSEYDRMRGTVAVNEDMKKVPPATVYSLKSLRRRSVVQPREQSKSMGSKSRAHSTTIGVPTLKMDTPTPTLGGVGRYHQETRVVPVTHGSHTVAPSNLISKRGSICSTTKEVSNTVDLKRLVRAKIGNTSQLDREELCLLKLRQLNAVDFSDFRVKVQSGIKQNEEGVAMITDFGVNSTVENVTHSTVHPFMSVSNRLLQSRLKEEPAMTMKRLSVLTSYPLIVSKSVFQVNTLFLNEHTTIPYCTLTSRMMGLQHSATKYLVLIVHDIFDTFLTNLSFAKDLLQEYQLPNTEVVLFNYEGQSHTLYSENTSFTAYKFNLHVDRLLYKLLQPGCQLYVIGMGYGGYLMHSFIANNQQSLRNVLRGVVLINSLPSMVGTAKCLKMAQQLLKVAHENRDQGQSVEITYRKILKEDKTVDMEEKKALNPIRVAGRVHLLKAIVNHTVPLQSSFQLVDWCRVWLLHGYPNELEVRNELDTWLKTRDGQSIRRRRLIRVDCRLEVDHYLDVIGRLLTQ